jgi:cell fate regulator YaaT (PSP1 superfamily)
MNYLLYNGQCCLNSTGCCKHRNKLNTYDWLSDIPDSKLVTNFVEVQFKSTRKEYFVNNNHLDLVKGDQVVVESNPGHDVGIVTLTGKLALLQMKKHRVHKDTVVRKIYRKAKPVDIEKYEEAKAKEHKTMIRARKIAENLRLHMKIGDVEYQGDGVKAIFYYIADERIDFRQLIKDLADAFKVRIEMKQIGARQEAARIGGIGSCGREVCCSGWMGNFASVGGSAIRLQDISPNPQKLAGQCSKLKCCFNYEMNAYMEAQRNFPSREIVLETETASYYHFKTDVFKNRLQYSTDKYSGYNLVTIPAERAYEVINLNKNGQKPYSLLSNEQESGPQRKYNDILGESITRFDSSKKKKTTFSRERRSQEPRSSRSRSQNTASQRKRTGES